MRDAPSGLSDAEGRASRVVAPAESAIAEMGELLGVHLPAEDLAAVQRSFERQAIDIAPLIDFVERSGTTAELFTPRW